MLEPVKRQPLPTSQRDSSRMDAKPGGTVWWETNPIPATGLLQGLQRLLPWHQLLLLVAAPNFAGALHGL